MKKLVLALLPVFCLLAVSSSAQITITASDMPVANDTLRYSIASPVGSSIVLTDTGANIAWDYSSLVPQSQAVDTYKTAIAVNIAYLLTIPSAAYGYKVADSLPIPGLPVSVQNIYTFFEKLTSPASYAAVAFGASVSGLPLGQTYSSNDVWYFFPLNYGNSDSAAYALNVSLASVGALQRVGYRKSHVDGWGTILTPYATTATNCIRIRSEIIETDSITFSGTTFGIPNNTVEYKWLANGEHYPLLWVTTLLTGSTETITSIRYRDQARQITSAVPEVGHPQTFQAINAYPVPSADGNVTLDMPADWNHYTVEVFDITSKLVFTAQSNSRLSLQGLSKGQYLVRVTNGAQTGYAKIEL